MTSKPSKDKDTSPSSEALYCCTAAAQQKHVFARRAKQTLPHLLHMAPGVFLGVILIAFTEPLLIFDC